ncbi:hypothetical protein SLS59_008228 [Nothophoma quercina]|uniref:Uncharacterized protein n=1 Tax=Nothophoma quercina TaxID=749835 RepID=A0ABR3QTW5_9PLEO
MPFVFLGRRDILDPAISSTQPIEIILQSIRQFCPEVNVQLWAFDTNSEQTPLIQETPHTFGKAAEEEWKCLTAAGKEVWILRPAPLSVVLSSQLGLSGWREGDFNLTNSERKRLDSNVWSCPIVLQRYGAPIHTKSEGVNNPVKYWDIVVSERCFLSTIIEKVDPELGKKVLTLQGAFEKELDMLRTTNETIEFASVSRWLDWTFLREMTKEKKKSLRSGALHRGEVEWKSRVGFSEERYLRTKGREMEWWDVVHDMNEHEILKLMTKSEDCGIRLGLSVKKNDGGSTEISFQGQRSTVDPHHIIAYVELLARFVFKTESYDTQRFAEQLEDFQLHRLAIPRERFELMLSF